MVTLHGEGRKTNLIEDNRKDKAQRAHTHWNRKRDVCYCGIKGWSCTASFGLQPCNCGQVGMTKI